jgi:hypothetical protein
MFYIIIYMNIINLGLMLGIGGAPVEAGRVTLNAQGQVTGITGLQIGDKTYNVSFFVTANPQTGQPPGPRGISMFEDNENGAKAAAAAIVELLNAQQPVPERVYGSPDNNNYEALASLSFNVYYSTFQPPGGNPDNLVYRSTFSDMWGDPKKGVNEGGSPRRGVVYAAFTMVPEPSSLILASLGVLVVGGYSWWHRKPGPREGVELLRPDRGTVEQDLVFPSQPAD